MKCLLAVLLAAAAVGATEKRAVYAPQGPKPVGPYTPGILAGDYLYVSGQGALDANGEMPAGFEAQARLTLQNVKGIVEAAGLTMAHVVSTQCFLQDLANADAFDRIYRDFFPKGPPARVLVQVARLPVGTPVEVNAVAVRELKNRKPVRGGVATHDRVYLSGTHALAVTFGTLFVTEPPARTPAPGLAMIQVAGLPARARAVLSGVETHGKDVFFASAASDQAGSIEDQTRNALGILQKRLAEAGLQLADVVASNVYLDNIDDFARMNRVYIEHFREMPPTRTTLQPAASTGGKLFEITVVAVRP